MKKLLALFLTMAMLCTISVSTMGCKGSTTTPPANTEAEKKEAGEKKEAAEMKEAGEKKEAAEKKEGT